MRTYVRLLPLFVLASVSVGTPVPHALADQADRALLLDGVGAIAAPGVPGDLCVFGPNAFVVVNGASGKMQAPVVAAGRMGEGRVVAFGHDGYFGEDALRTHDTGRLMANALRWSGTKDKPKVAVRRLGGLLTYLQEAGFEAEAVDGDGWTEQLSGFDVVCLHPARLSSAEEIAGLAGFVRSGGGLIAGDTGWGWLQLHPGKRLPTDHPGTALLAGAGLVWADGMLKPTAERGFAVEAAPSVLAHAGNALDAVEAHAAGQRVLAEDDLAQAAWTLTHAARSLPPGDQLLLPRLRRLQEDYVAEAIPTPDKPLSMENPLGRLALTLQLEDLKELPAAEVRAHPAAEHFPGAVPDDAPKVSATVAIDTSVPAWHSTGLYAAPGEAIDVRVPDAAAGKGLKVRIGAHNDRLWGNDSWRRVPEICRVFPVADASTAAANTFGGLVYIEAPKDCALGKVSVEIEGAVEAPHYVLGETDLDEWRRSIRHRPAPWAELAGERVILTVPSTAVRELDDPEGLMRFWDQVLDACADLAQIPRERERPERYVTDVQISAGYMHSGYPVMTHLDMAEVVVDKAGIVANEHGGIWGLFHEMGHNHQSGDWTFGGAGEVTVNLFTLYVFDTVIGRRVDAHPALSAESRTKKLAEYFAGGPDFGDWKRDPFLALIMYVQLQEAFGWDAFKAVFAEYRGLPDDQRPKDDDEERDQWMVRFSRAVGRNLGPFFETWGVPTSPAARESITDLAEWMPEGLPPK